MPAKEPRIRAERAEFLNRGEVMRDLRGRSQSNRHLQLLTERAQERGGRPADLAVADRPHEQSVAGVVEHEVVGDDDVGRVVGVDPEPGEECVGGDARSALDIRGDGRGTERGARDGSDRVGQQCLARAGQRTAAHQPGLLADTNEGAVARLTVSVKDSDAKRIGRPFSSAAVEIALASYPGASMTAPPGEATPYGVYQAAYIPNARVEHRVVTQNDERVEIHA